MITAEYQVAGEDSRDAKPFREKPVRVEIDRGEQRASTLFRLTLKEAEQLLFALQGAVARGEAIEAEANVPQPEPPTASAAALPAA